MVLATGTITAVRDRIAWGEFTQGQHAGRTLDMPAVYDDGSETFVITAGDGVTHLSRRLDEASGNIVDLYVIEQAARGLLLWTVEDDQGLDIVDMRILHKDAN